MSFINVLTTPKSLAMTDCLYSCRWQARNGWNCFRVDTHIQRRGEESDVNGWARVRGRVRVRSRVMVYSGSWWRGHGILPRKPIHTQTHLKVHNGVLVDPIEPCWIRTALVQRHSGRRGNLIPLSRRQMINATKPGLTLREGDAIELPLIFPCNILQPHACGFGALCIK